MSLYILITRATDSTSDIAVSTNNTTWSKNVVGDNIKENIVLFINRETHNLEGKNGTTNSLTSQEMFNVLINDQSDSTLDLSDLQEYQQHQNVSCSKIPSKMKKSPKVIREEVFKKKKNQETQSMSSRQNQLNQLKLLRTSARKHTCHSENERVKHVSEPHTYPNVSDTFRTLLRTTPSS
ncbi:hypothetical protein GEMRC1_013675 [Eukaryota sp. GEM-RC1]